MNYTNCNNSNCFCHKEFPNEDTHCGTCLVLNFTESNLRKVEDENGN